MSGSSIPDTLMLFLGATFQKLQPMHRVFPHYAAMNFVLIYFARLIEKEGGPLFLFPTPHPVKTNTYVANRELAKQQQRSITELLLMQAPQGPVKCRMAGVILYCFD